MNFINIKNIITPFVVFLHISSVRQTALTLVLTNFFITYVQLWQTRNFHNFTNSRVRFEFAKMLIFYRNNPSSHMPYAMCPHVFFQLIQGPSLHFVEYQYCCLKYISYPYIVRREVSPKCGSGVTKILLHKLAWYRLDISSY